MSHNEFFVVGDVVRLLSGSPDMTVSKIYDPDPEAADCECIWFEASTLHKVDLLYDTISLVKK